MALTAAYPSPNRAVGAPQIVDIYLGPAFAGSVSTLRVLMLGALPWGIYMSLRTVIDARHKRPINAINVGISFAFFVALMLTLRIWMDPAAVVVPVFVISLYVLGALTVIELWRVTHGPPPAEASRSPSSIPASPPVPTSTARAMGSASMRAASANRTCKR